MSTPIITRSSDAGAPVLSGTAGAMIGVLDYCLVTRLGWAKVFSGTNLASYRAPAGIRHYLDVVDTGTTATTVRGYETMSAVGTGTGPFPSVAQAASGGTLTKSGTADGTARPWICFGDDRTAYLFWRNNLTGFPQPWVSSFAFGEFLSVGASDNYRSILMTSIRPGVQQPGGSSPRGWAPRSYLGVSTSAHLSVFQDGTLTGVVAVDDSPYGVIPFPNPADGGLYLGRLGLTEHGTTTAFTATTITCLRGQLRGMYQVAHPAASFAEGDTFDGVGVFAGRSFIVSKLSPGSPGVAAIEMTAWDTNV